MEEGGLKPLEPQSATVGLLPCRGLLQAAGCSGPGPCPLPPSGWGPLCSAAGRQSSGETSGELPQLSSLRILVCNASLCPPAPPFPFPEHAAALLHVHEGAGRCDLPRLRRERNCHRARQASSPSRPGRWSRRPSCAWEQPGLYGTRCPGSHPGTLQHPPGRTATTPALPPHTPPPLFLSNTPLLPALGLPWVHTQSTCQCSIRKRHLGQIVSSSCLYSPLISNRN